MSADLPFTPVVIIGAGRSGTNILRDSLTALPDFATWECDEINPIWRHGNVFWPDDVIPPNRATPSVKAYIRRAFQRIWRTSGQPAFVVEKTCANSLRVPFVDRVLPEAKYLYLVRDGTDIVPSAMKRWQGDLEVGGMSYFLAKARYAPWTDLPLYGWSFLKNRIGMALGRSRHLSTWGPRFPDMNQHVQQGLEAVCAHQWATCVEASDQGFDEIDPDRVLHLKYEDLTTAPAKTLGRVTAFLGMQASPEALAEATKDVRQSSVGKGRKILGPALSQVLDLIGPTLAKHGYPIKGQGL